MELNLSNYGKTLSGDERKRYVDKIKILWCGDPFQYDPQSLNNSEILNVIPPITQIDIIDYFVNKKSAYTLKDFKAHKSLEAFNHFISGHITFERWIEQRNVFVIFGKVSVRNIFVSKQS